MSAAISVVMPAYNAARFVDAAIQSIRAQSFRDFEFVIVDDGSTDGTTRIAEAHANEDPRIKLIRQRQSGCMAAIIRGMREASAPYVARMDADDISHHNRFATQIAFLEENPSIAVVGTSVEFIDENGRITGTRHCPENHDEIATRLLHKSPLYHPSVMMRREMIEAVGGYDRRFVVAEDYRLWLNVAAEYELANIDEPLLRYRRHTGQMTHRRNSFYSAFAYIDYLAGRYAPTNSATGKWRELTYPELVRTIRQLFDAPLRREERKALFYHIPRVLRCNFGEAWANELQRAANRHALKDRNFHFGVRSLFYRVF